MDRKLQGIYRGLTLAVKIIESSNCNMKNKTSMLVEIRSHIDNVLEQQRLKVSAAELRKENLANINH